MSLLDFTPRILNSTRIPLISAAAISVQFATIPLSTAAGPDAGSQAGQAIRAAHSAGEAPELLAIADPEGQFWTPEGTRLPAPPERLLPFLSSHQQTLSDDTRDKAHLFFICDQPAAPLLLLAWDLNPPSSYQTNILKPSPADRPHAADGRRIVRLSTEMPKRRQHMSLTLRLPAAAWATTIAISPEDGHPVVSSFEQTDQGVAVCVRDNLNVDGVRFVAHAHDGEIHTPASLSTFINYDRMDTTARFTSLTLNDVREFLVQERPYCEITYSQVATRPGILTSHTVTRSTHFRAAATAEPEKQGTLTLIAPGKPPRSSAVDRLHSLRAAQILTGLGLTADEILSLPHLRIELLAIGTAQEREPRRVTIGASLSREIRSSPTALERPLTQYFGPSVADAAHVIAVAGFDGTAFIDITTAIIAAFDCIDATTDNISTPSPVPNALPGIRDKSRREQYSSFENWVKRLAASSPALLKRELGLRAARLQDAPPQVTANSIHSVLTAWKANAEASQMIIVGDRLAMLIVPRMHISSHRQGAALLIARKDAGRWHPLQAGHFSETGILLHLCALFCDQP